MTEISGPYKSKDEFREFSGPVGTMHIELLPVCGCGTIYHLTSTRHRLRSF